MTLILVILLAIPAYVLWDSDRLASWLCIGAIVLLILFSMNFREDAKAYVRRREYWANGGPDKK